MKDSEKGMGRFILRKKHAGRSTQLELVTLEKDGVLEETDSIGETKEVASNYYCHTFH